MVKKPFTIKSSLGDRSYSKRVFWQEDPFFVLDCNFALRNIRFQKLNVQRYAQQTAKEIIEAVAGYQGDCPDRNFCYSCIEGIVRVYVTVITKVVRLEKEGYL
jgi:hypothetical protein